MLFWLCYVRCVGFFKGCCDFKTLFNSGLWRATPAFTKISTKQDACNPSQPSFLHRLYRNLRSLLFGANGIIPSAAPYLTRSLRLPGDYENSHSSSLSNQLCITLVLQFLWNTSPALLTRMPCGTLLCILTSVRFATSRSSRPITAAKNEMRLAWHSLVLTNPPF